MLSVIIEWSFGNNSHRSLTTRQQAWKDQERIPMDLDSGTNGLNIRRDILHWGCKHSIGTPKASDRRHGIVYETLRPHSNPNMER